MTAVGQRIRLVRCSDPHTRLQSGAVGVVRFIDALGTVHVDWSDGHSLGLVPGEDQWVDAPFVPDAILHGSDGPGDPRDQRVRVISHVRIDGTKLVRVEKESGVVGDYPSRYVTAYNRVACLECEDGEVDWDTDADDGAGALVCNACGTEYRESEKYGLIRAVDWCDRCGDQAVCPDCKGA